MEEEAKLALPATRKQIDTALDQGRLVTRCDIAKEKETCPFVEAYNGCCMGYKIEQLPTGLPEGEVDPWYKTAKVGDVDYNCVP